MPEISREEYLEAVTEGVRKAVLFAVTIDFNGDNDELFFQEKFMDAVEKGICRAMKEVWTHGTTP